MTASDMHSLPPQRPALYRLAADGLAIDFLYARCPACKRLSFPANAPGCMHCGDLMDGAESVAQSGGGTLLEYVTVHVPLAPGLDVPFIVGDVQIAPGVIEEGILNVTNESDLKPGMKLRAVAVTLPSGHYDCRFVPVEEQCA